MTMLFSLSNNEKLTQTICSQLKIELGKLDIRHFPDGESYIRIDSDVNNKTVFLLSSLEYPNEKVLTLMFVAQTLKELGANKICLIAPYLPYMRQDKRFKSGEAVTASLFAKYLSSFIDALITIDPHLHRIHDLSEIYNLNSIATLHATKEIALWIKQQVKSPLIIGPDEESKQWVSDVAKQIDAPFIIIKKIRHGDRSVDISIPEISDSNKTAVLVDDIISTGTSMTAALKQLTNKGFKKSVCIAVHALFDKKTYKNLLQAGAKQIVSCNTISHFSNAIDIDDLILNAIKNKDF